MSGQFTALLAEETWRKKLEGGGFRVVLDPIDLAAPRDPLAPPPPLLPRPRLLR